MKNEIRKRETVAVCRGAGAGDVEQEMLRARRCARSTAAGRGGFAEGSDVALLARCFVAFHLAAEIGRLALDCWKIYGCPEPALSLPKGLDSETWDSARRWLRLAPRLSGPNGAGCSCVALRESAAAHLLERVRDEVESGEIGVRVELN